jgi:hypothetical protein
MTTDVNRLLQRLDARGTLTVTFAMRSHPLPTYRVWRWDDWGPMRDYGCDHRDGDTGPRWHTLCPATPVRPWWTVTLERRPAPPFDRSWVYELMGFGTYQHSARSLTDAAQHVLDATVPPTVWLDERVADHVWFRDECRAYRPAAELADWLRKLDVDA